MIKSIAVLTSGGDAPGMNAAIRAVTRTALQMGLKVYGVHDGYLGLYKGQIEELTRRSVSEKLGAGGTFLGTARLPEFTDPEIRKVALRNLHIYEIDALIAIGGDGTYRGALALNQMGLPVVTIPGTIDNDIAGTEFTIGFDTALNTVVEAADKLRDTSSSHRRCSIIEVMGRNCGDMAVWSAIACGAEVCIAKETGFNLQDVIENIKNAAQHKRHAIVIVAEHIVDSEELAREITKATPFEARATVLGHIQRGGSPTVRDRVLASEMGVKAVYALLDGDTHHCVATNGNQVISMPIEDALNGDDTQQTLREYEVFKVLW
ncbi:MAG: 6-phosphofructokinase [Acholeplasmataceae bacterium]|nr:6-phosphofructokinase [Acholeplasmataceae bacterium]